MYRKLIRAVACLLLAAMLLPLSPVRAADGPDAVSPPAEPQALSGFTDTRGHWAWAWIELAYSDNIKNDHSGAAYARNEFRKPSLTVELTASTVFPHNSAKFYSEIWPYVKDLYLEAMTYYK